MRELALTLQQADVCLGRKFSHDHKVVFLLQKPTPVKRTKRFFGRKKTVSVADIGAPTQFKSVPDLSYFSVQSHQPDLQTPLAPWQRHSPDNRSTKHTPAASSPCAQCCADAAFRVHEHCQAHRNHFKSKSQHNVAGPEIPTINIIHSRPIVLAAVSAHFERFASDRSLPRRL